MGAVEVVHAAVGDDHVGSGGGSVHLAGCRLLVAAAALVDVVEYQRRGDRARDVHAVEYERHHGVRVVFGVVSQVYGDLSLAERAAEPVRSRRAYGDHSVSLSLLGIVLVGLGALAVVAALAGLVVDYVVADGHVSGVLLRNGQAVQRDLVIAEHQRALALVSCGHFLRGGGAGGGCRRTRPAGRQRQSDCRSGQYRCCALSSVHVYISFTRNTGIILPRVEA